MTQQEPKSLCLFIDHDIFGVAILNGVIPRLIEQGYRPVIINAENSRNVKPRIPHPETSKLFNNGVLDRVILPFLRTQEPNTLKAMTPQQLAEKYGLEYHVIGELNPSEIAEIITSQPNYAGSISQRFSQVFPPPLVDFISRRGFFWNMHSGLVPDYKGLLTLFPAIKNREEHYGMTLHEMAYLVDDGAVIEQTRLPLNPENPKPMFELYLDTVQGGIDMLTRSTGLMATQGYVPTMPQTGRHADGYYTNPTSAEFNQAAQEGVIYADITVTPALMAGMFTHEGTIQNRILESQIDTFLEDRHQDWTLMPLAARDSFAKARLG